MLVVPIILKYYAGMLCAGHVPDMCRACLESNLSMCYVHKYTYFSMKIQLIEPLSTNVLCACSVTDAVTDII